MDQQPAAMPQAPAQSMTLGDQLREQAQTTFAARKKKAMWATTPMNAQAPSSSIDIFGLASLGGYYGQ